MEMAGIVRSLPELEQGESPLFCWPAIPLVAAIRQSRCADLIDDDFAIPNPFSADRLADRGADLVIPLGQLISVGATHKHGLYERSINSFRFHIRRVR